MTSADLKPGDRFHLDRNHYPGGSIYTLDRRKTSTEDDGWPGWWLVGGGGFADFVLDDYIASDQLVLIRDDEGYNAMRKRLKDANSDALLWAQRAVGGRPDDR